MNKSLKVIGILLIIISLGFLYWSIVSTGGILLYWITNFSKTDINGVFAVIMLLLIILFFLGLLWSGVIYLKTDPSYFEQNTNLRRSAKCQAAALIYLGVGFSTLASVLPHISDSASAPVAGSVGLLLIVPPTILISFIGLTFFVASRK